MASQTYESTLNAWLAELLRAEGLAAKPEVGQGGGKRLDVEVVVDDIKVALEAEQGTTPTKKASAIGDADGRIADDLAYCAVAICYPAGLMTAGELAVCTLLYTVRTPSDSPEPKKTTWQQGDIPHLVSVIRKIPDQLGDPDHIANELSTWLNLAVARLREGQKRDLAAALDLPSGKATKLEFGTALSSSYNQAAKRAMLVIATAVMFHARLDAYRHDLKPKLDNRQIPPQPFAADWPPPRASECAASDDPIGKFERAWDLWLAVDYKPIFATARNALLSCAQNVAWTAAVRLTARAAIRVVRNVVGLRHDLLGRIFHRVLDTARYDGSFYTTTAAATLLATLAIRDDMCDWSDPEAIARLRITDPACGTGTLLMAAAERIRDLTSGAQGKENISRILIENVLTGYDVNLTATHLAATTLGLLSPTTTFKEMKMYRALLGVENGEAKLGSLEFLSPEPDRQPRLLPWPTGIEQIEDSEAVTEAEAADLVIMNPPFTRDSLRHDQFSREDEKKLKSREKELFASLPTHLSGNSGSFLLLATHLLSATGGVLACILPAVIATNSSGLGIRRFLADKFFVEAIISSHDPTRIYFSENTTIGEMLLICRQRPREAIPTKVVNLYENPPTPSAALAVAREIIEGKPENIKGSIQAWPHTRIAVGNWGGVQFLSAYLCERFVALAEGDLFRTLTLESIAHVGPAGRRTQDAFEQTVLPDAGGRVALWNHRSDRTQTMCAAIDSYIVPVERKAHLAERYWSQRSRFLLANRLRLNTMRCTSVRLPTKVLGARWVPCRFKVDEPHNTKFEKAACTYLNSTIGILAMIGDRTTKILSYPQFSLDDLRRIPVPDFPAMSESQISILATAYDTLCEMTLLPLPQMQQCATRKALDRAVISALGIEAEVVAQIRRELAREPSITGKPYMQTRLD